MKNILHLISVIIILVSLSCCQKDNVCADNRVISRPMKTGDGWQTSSLDSVGINSEKLQVLVNRICDSTYQNIHSIVIVKDSKLVFEHYFGGYTFKYEADECKGRFIRFNRDILHNLHSVTKSVTSIIFGIAYDKGLITDVNDTLFKYFPKYAALNDTIKSQITLHDALTMTSGFEWNSQEVFIKDSRHDIIRMFNSADPVKYILLKPVIHEPGSTFCYNGGNTNLIGEVVHKATGMMLNDIAKKYLFDPLGIDRSIWTYFSPEMIYASGSLKLRPRDMAKIGFLMLNKGVWKDKQILSAEWIEKSTAAYVHFNKRDGYGYHWWTKKYVLGNISVSLFTAMGWGGQRIMVIPDLDAVVVLTGGNYESGDPTDEMMYRYILPSLKENFIYDYENIKSEAPISESINIIKPSKNVKPEIAKLSGHWYGWGDYWIAGQLIVEQIDSANASVVYAWGDHPDGYFKRGWVRKPATVDSLGQISFSFYDVHLRFKLDKDENVIIGDYTKGQARSKLIFNRL